MEKRKSMADLLANARIPIVVLLISLVILPVIIWLIEITNTAFDFLAIYIAILSLYLPREDIQYEISELLLTVSMVATRLGLLHLIVVPFFKVVNSMTQQAENNIKQ